MPQKYLKLYNNHTTYGSDSRPDTPNVSHCIEEDHVHYTVDLLNMPLTFEAKTGTTSISFIHRSPANIDYSTKTIKVSTDNGTTWTSKTSTRAGTLLGTINQGEKMLVVGDNDRYTGGTSDSWNYFATDNDVYVYGNIASLIQSTNFENIDRDVLLYKGYVFDHLFWNMQKMYSHSRKDIIAPFGKVGSNCYRAMFSGCINITKPMQLLTTKLNNNCYDSMFSGCTSLTTAPSLPLTTLDEECYNYMFYGCTSLTESPVLPATTLATKCYQYMFKGCSSLNKITCMATNISATDCTKEWVDGVAATGTFIKDDTMTNWTTGISGIPTGWTVQNVSVKLDYYELSSNEYIEIGFINPNNDTYRESSSSLVYGVVQVVFYTGTTITDIADQTIVTSGGEFSTNNSQLLIVNGVQNTNGNTTSSSAAANPYYMLEEAYKASGNYNNAIWSWCTGWSNTKKRYFLVHGQQPWDFVNNPIYIGSLTGNSVTAKIARILVRFPVNSTETMANVYPYKNSITNKVVFKSDDGTYVYEVKSI